jgi:hypothetical protein
MIAMIRRTGFPFVVGFVVGSAKGCGTRSGPAPRIPHGRPDQLSATLVDSVSVPAGEPLAKPGSAETAPTETRLSEG